MDQQERDHRQELERRMVTLLAWMRNTKESVDDFNETLVDYLADLPVELIQLRRENARLREALAYFYRPTDGEFKDFEHHRFDTLAGGAAEPDGDEYWSEFALQEWEDRPGA